MDREGRDDGPEGGFKSIITLNLTNITSIASADPLYFGPVHPVFIDDTKASSQS